MLRWISLSALLGSLSLSFSLMAISESDMDHFLSEFAKRHSMFREGYFQKNEDAFSRLVKEGQFPPTLFIGCSDSRFVPEVITYSRPGDLFVIRTAGNFVPKYDQNIPWDGVAASIQYSVETVKIADIIVCGHSHCGAIQGLFAPPNPQEDSVYGQNVAKWLQFGQPAKEEVLSIFPKNVSQREILALTEKSSVLFQLENLMSYPFIKKAVEEGRLRLHGWYYTIETGDVDVYVPEQGRFVNLALFNPNREKSPL